jgi:hypothetical protein
MKGMWMAVMVAGLLASCERKEQLTGTTPPPEPEKQGIAAVGPSGEGENPAKMPSGKTSERPVLVKKKPPVAEPVADKPGFVKSPFSGKIIDVRGIPAGTLVADPMYPTEEKKHFRVPELSPEAAELLARESAPEGKPVPGKAGFIFSPYDNKIIDVTGLKPGEIVTDPTAPAGEVRYIKIPGDAPAILDPTKLIDPPPPPPSEEP